MFLVEIGDLENQASLTESKR